MKKVIFFSFLIITLFTVSCTQSGSAETLDYDAFIELLAKNGFQYSEENPDTEYNFLSVARRPIFIGDDIVSIYEYVSIEAMEADSLYIDKSGFSIRSENGGTEISWVSNPYFFKRGTLIINYVGENEKIIEFLFNNFGTPFAGYGVNS